jgi:hypothetical protein
MVLDVPADAISLHYGFFLKGGEALWVTDIRVEGTTAASPLTAAPVRQRWSVPAWIRPTNLTFSEVIEMPAATS